MRAYSLDLRQRVMKAYDEGKWTVGQIAERFKVGEWWVHKLKRQRKAGAGIGPRKGKVGQPRRLAPGAGQPARAVCGQASRRHPGADPREDRGHLHDGDHPQHAATAWLPL